MSKVSIIVNGVEFTKFLSVTIGRSLDSIAGVFSVRTAVSALKDFPIKVGDLVTAKINGDALIKGYIEKREVSYNINSHDIIFSGFDKTIALLKGQIFANASYGDPISLEALFTKVMRDNGIEDIDVSGKSELESFKDAYGSFFEDESFDFITVKKQVIAGETGETIFDFCDRYAVEQGSLLKSDGNGDLLIYNNVTDNISSKIVNKFGSGTNKGIKNGNFYEDFDNRFKKIIVLSQKNGGTVEDMAVKAEVIDNGVQREGTKVILVDSALDLDQVKQIADWELNNRIANSRIYSCDVAGFENESGDLWSEGQLVDIQDDYAGVNSKMLLRSVEYSFDQENGSISSLSFVDSLAYKKAPVIKIDDGGL